MSTLRDQSACVVRSAVQLHPEPIYIVLIYVVLQDVEQFSYPQCRWRLPNPGELVVSQTRIVRRYTG